MATQEEFIDICIKAIENYKDGVLSLNKAAAKINSNPFEYPVEENVHPMLYKVADLAFDIAEDYRTEDEDRAGWEILTETLEHYTKGAWEPTCWIVSAMYGLYSDEILTHSYSVSIKRQNGNTLLETASDELKSKIAEVIKRLNFDQTDERYLQNLAKLLPKSIGKFKLVSVEVAEYLTEPYYSTAG